MSHRRGRCIYRVCILPVFVDVGKGAAKTAVEAANVAPPQLPAMSLYVSVIVGGDLQPFLVEVFLRLHFYSLE